MGVGVVFNVGFEVGVGVGDGTGLEIVITTLGEYES